MNAIDLLAALTTVEQDHQLVLDHVQALREAVTCLLDPEAADRADALDRLWEISAYLATAFEAHMEEEETTLFPLLEQARPEGPDLATRLREEHMEIRRGRAEFDDCLRVGEGLEGGPPRMVVADLVLYGWDLWELLHNHAHRETQAVQGCVSRALRRSPTPAST